MWLGPFYYFFFFFTREKSEYGMISVRLSCHPASQLLFFSQLPGLLCVLAVPTLLLLVFGSKDGSTID